MRIVHGESWRRWHFGRFLICLAVALAAIVWYAIEWFRNGLRPGGSSAPGLATGIVAGLLFFYLFFYALRKTKWLSWWFSRKPTKARLAQHIWLGLLTFPLVVVHIGVIPRLGLLPMALLVVYLLVFASGVWGLVRQHFLPKRMLEQVPDETILEQAPAYLGQLKREAEILVYATCGAEKGKEHEALALLDANRDQIKAARSGRGAGLLGALLEESVPGSDSVRQYFFDVIVPYLDYDKGGSRVRLSAKIQSEFIDLRRRAPEKAHPVIKALEHVCDIRRQIDEQMNLHAKLHGWISFHLCCSVALLVLLLWHAYTSFLYW